MNKELFKNLERLNNLRNSISEYFTIPYEKRISNHWYNRLIIEADKVAKEIVRLDNSIKIGNWYKKIWKNK